MHTFSPCSIAKDRTLAPVDRSARNVGGYAGSWDSDASASIHNNPKTNEEGSHAEQRTGHDSWS